eukprot:s216_g13.t1
MKICGKTHAFCGVCGGAWQDCADPAFHQDTKGSKNSQNQRHVQWAYSDNWDAGTSWSSGAWDQGSHQTQPRQWATSPRRRQSPRRRGGRKGGKPSEHPKGSAKGKGKQFSPELEPPGPPSLDSLTVLEPPWKPVLVNPPPVVPSVPPQQEDRQFKAIISALKRHSDTLPSEVQAIVNEVALKDSQQETKQLHSAVAAHGRARKELQQAQLARHNLHSAWKSFLGQAVTQWQAYGDQFIEQERQLTERVNAAVLSLEHAKENLAKSKSSAGVETKEDSMNISDDDTDLAKKDVSNATAERIQESLTGLHTSLAQMKSSAEKMVEEEHQALKRPRLEPTPETPSVPPPDGPGPEDGSIHDFFKLDLPNEVLEMNDKPWSLHIAPFHEASPSSLSKSTVFDVYQFQDNSRPFCNPQLDASLHEVVSCESKMLASAKQSPLPGRSHDASGKSSISGVEAIQKVPQLEFHKPLPAVMRRNFESPLIGFVGRDIEGDTDDDEGEDRRPMAPILPAFAIDLAARARGLGMDPLSPDFDLPVRSWFLDHMTIRRWFSPRLLQLVGPVHTWEAQIAALWVDQINPDFWFDVTVVDPSPPRHARHAFVTFDIIIAQSIDLPRYAGMVTVHPSKHDASFQMYSVAISFPERVSGYSVIQASDAARYCRYRHCIITQRWFELPNTMRETHQMGHGDSFQVFVQMRNPEEAAASTAPTDQVSSGASSSHQAPDHPAASTSHGSNVNHANTDWDMHHFMTTMHVFSLDREAIVITLVNDQDIAPSQTIAQALAIPLQNLEVLHQIPMRPDDIPRQDIAVIAQCSGNIELGEDCRLLLIDIFYHNHPVDQGHSTRPMQVRQVRCTAAQILRDSLFTAASVYQYCTLITQHCTVELDGIPWPSEDWNPRRVHHGSYARVDVPPPPGYDLPTHQAASTLETDAILGLDTIAALLEDDAPEQATSLLQQSIAVHPSSRGQGEGPLSIQAALNPLYQGINEPQTSKFPSNNATMQRANHDHNSQEDQSWNAIPTSNVMPSAVGGDTTAAPEHVETPQHFAIRPTSVDSLEAVESPEPLVQCQIEQGEGPLSSLAVLNPLTNSPRFHQSDVRHEGNHFLTPAKLKQPPPFKKMARRSAKRASKVDATQTTLLGFVKPRNLPAPHSKIEHEPVRDVDDAENSPSVIVPHATNIKSEDASKPDDVQAHARAFKQTPADRPCKQQQSRSPSITLHAFFSSKMSNHPSCHAYQPDAPQNEPPVELSPALNTNDDADKTASAKTIQARCSDAQVASGPVFERSVPQMAPPQFPPQGGNTMWRLDLQGTFEELAFVEHAVTGPVMYVQVWYVDSIRHPSCPTAKVVRLDDVQDLWYEDICRPWLDQISVQVPLFVWIVRPTPPYTFHEHATIHIILEQNVGREHVALLFTAAFHGGSRVGLFQVAESAPRRISTSIMVRKHRFQDFCFLRTCRMFSGNLQFYEHDEDEVHSGISVLLDIGPPPQQASDDSHRPGSSTDAVSLLQRKSTMVTKANPQQPILPSVILCNMPEIIQTLRWQIDYYQGKNWRHNAGANFPIASWFIDMSTHCRSGEPRRVLLPTHPSGWIESILQRWNDKLDPFSQIDIRVVGPDPCNLGTDEVAQVVVVQKPQPHFAAIVTEVVDMTLPLQYRRVCIVVPSLVTATDVTNAIVDLLQYEVDTLVIQHGDTVIPQCHQYPVCTGYILTVMPTGQAETADNDSALIRLSFASVHQLIHSTRQALYQAMRWTSCSPCCCPEPSDSDHTDVDTPASHRDNQGTNRQLPPFFSVLKQLWRPLAALGPAGMEESAPVLTWFVDHIRLPQCFRARAVQLFEDEREWIDLIRRTWADAILPDQELHLFLVQPNPVAMEPQVMAHLLVVQQPIPNFRTILVTTFDSSLPGVHRRHASMCPQEMSQYFLYGLAFVDRDCNNPQNTCSAWHGEDEILPDERIDTVDGQSFTVAIHRHIAPGLPEENPWDSTAQPSSPHKVTLSLQASIPDAKAASGIAWDDGKPQLLWFENQAWKIELQEKYPVRADTSDNIAAELSALAIAQLLVLQWPHHTHHPLLCIRPDLALSKTISEATTTCRSNRLLAQICKSLGLWVSNKAAVVEVRGHTQHPWNELADTIAKWSLQTGESIADPDVQALHEYAKAPQDIAWSWMQTTHPAMSACFPTLFDQQILQIDPCNTAVPIVPTERTTQSHCSDPFVHWKVHAKTANVLATEVWAQQAVGTRRTGQRTLRLDQQWHRAGAHVIGVQEARTAAGRYQSPHYHIFASGAKVARAPLYGCELWVHRTLPMATDHQGRPIVLGDAAFTVQHADPRRLFIQAQLDDLRLTFVTLHTPCLGSPQQNQPPPLQVLKDWWDETSVLVNKFVPSSFAWILIDANSPLDGGDGSLFGEHGAETLTKQGELFKAFLQRHELAVPATFAELHTGITTTWTHSSGNKSRKDYVLIPKDMLPVADKSWVDQDHDTSFAHEDHLPVTLL